jgi:hypothetical protein
MAIRVGSQISAALDVGAHLIAQAVGPGRILLMTRDEARADLIAQIRADAGVTGPTDTDSTADVRVMRREDQAAADTKATAPVDHRPGHLPSSRARCAGVDRTQRMSLRHAPMAVLDASAVLAFIFDERGASTVEKVLPHAVITAANMGYLRDWDRSLRRYSMNAACPCGATSQGPADLAGGSGGRTTLGPHLAPTRSQRARELRPRPGNH